MITSKEVLKNLNLQRLVSVCGSIDTEDFCLTLLVEVFSIWTLDMNDLELHIFLLYYFNDCLNLFGFVLSIDFFNYLFRNVFQLDIVVLVVNKAIHEHVGVCLA